MYNWLWKYSNWTYRKSWLALLIWLIKRDIKKIIPLFVLLILILSSLACGGGGDIVSTGTSVRQDANTVTEVLDSSMLEDANNALLQAGRDINDLSCNTGITPDNLCK